MIPLLRHSRSVSLLVVLALATPAAAHAEYAIAFEFETLRGYCCGTRQTLAPAGRAFVLGVSTDLGAFVTVRDARTGAELLHVNADRGLSTDDTHLFGWAVASSAHGLLIGAPSAMADGTGGTLVLKRGQVDPIRTLRSPDAGAWYFGTAVLWIGSNVVVGDEQRNLGNSGDGPGVAYIFDGHTGATLATLHPPTLHDAGGFGTTATAFHGGFAIAEPGTWTTAGAVHLYDRNGRYLQTLTAPSPAAGDLFGIALASSGRQLLIGAPRAPAGGAVYLARRAHGQWNIVRTFAGAAYDADFGASVALDGHRAALGSPETYRGVYLFDTASDTAPEHVAPPPIDPDTGLGYHDGLGYAVALVGDTLVVASSTPDENDAAYVVGYRTTGAR